MRLFPRARAYAVRTFDAARDPDDQGRLWTYVNMESGAIMGQRHDVGTSAGDLFLGWQYALHSGKFAGLPGGPRRGPARLAHRVAVSECSAALPKAAKAGEGLGASADPAASQQTLSIHKRALQHIGAGLVVGPFSKPHAIKHGRHFAVHRHGTT